MHFFVYFALLTKSGKWLVLANCNVPCLDHRIAECSLKNDQDLSRVKCYTETQGCYQISGEYGG